MGNWELHPGIEVKKRPSFQAVGRRLSTAEVLGSTWAPLDQLQSTFDEVLVRLGCCDATKLGKRETQQIATQQKTWCQVYPQNLYPTKNNGATWMGLLRKTTTRPWRFPGHIQRLHRKGEEERQQRHSLVDQWPDMILKGCFCLICCYSRNLGRRGGMNDEWILVKQDVCEF